MATPTTTAKNLVLNELVRSVRDVLALEREPGQMARWVGGALRPFLGNPHLLAPEQREPDTTRYRQHILHAEDDGRFSIVALVWLPDQATVMRSVSSVRRLLHMDPGFPDARVHAGPSRPRALRVAPRSARNSPCAARMASSLFHHFGRRSDCLIVGRQRVARAEEIGDGLERHLPNLRVGIRERVAEAEVCRTVRRAHRHGLRQ